MASVDNNSSVKPVKNKGKPASLSNLPNPSSKGKPASRISSSSTKPSSLPTKPSEASSNPPPVTKAVPKPSSNQPPTMENLLKLTSIKTELGEKIDAAKKINLSSSKTPNHGKDVNIGSGSSVISSGRTDTNNGSGSSVRTGPRPKSRMRPTNSAGNKPTVQNSSILNPASASKPGNSDTSKNTGEKEKGADFNEKFADLGGLDFEQELDNMLKSAEMIFNKPIDTDISNQKKIESNNVEKLLDESIASEHMDTSFEEVIQRENEDNTKRNSKEKSDSFGAANEKPNDDDDIIVIEFENTPVQREVDSKLENQAMMNNNKLIELQVELLKKNEEIDSNADQIDILTVKNQDLNEDLEKNKQKMEELNEDIQDLQKKFDRAKAAKEELFKNNKKAEATISEIKSTLSSKDEELKKKKKELAEKSSLNSEFYKRLLDLTKLNTEFSAKTKQTEDNFKRKEEELKNKEASEKMLQKEIKKLIPKITELEKTIFEKAQEIEDLDEKLKSLENILKEKNALLDTKEESDKLMQSEIDELKRDQVEKEKVSSELYKQLLHLTKQNTDSSARIKQLEDDLQNSDSLKRELEDLKTQNAELKSTADEKTRLHSLAESKMIVAETSLKEKESLLEGKILEVNTYKEEISKLKVTAEEKNVLHDSTASKLGEFEILVREKESALLKKESEVSILQGENLELKLKVSHLNENKNELTRINEEKIKNLEATIEEKDKSLNHKLGDEEDLQEKIAGLKREIGELKVSAEGKNKLNLKLSTKARKVEDILSVKEKIIKTMVTAESMLCVDIETLKTRLEELKNGDDSKETIIEEFASKFECLEGRLKQDYFNNSLEPKRSKRKSNEPAGNSQKRRNYEDSDTIDTIQEFIDNILDNVAV